MSNCIEGQLKSGNTPQEHSRASIAVYILSVIDLYNGLNCGITMTKAKLFVIVYRLNCASPK